MALKKKDQGKNNDKIKDSLNPDNNLVAVIDGDYIIFKASAVADEHFITATHTKSGSSKEFKNVTEFKGRGKVLGGWLGEQNEERTEKGKSLLALEDFTITKGVRREKKEDAEGNTLTDDNTLSHYFYSARTMLTSVLKELGASDYVMYIGGKEEFRLNKSKLMKYKGNRDDVQKPLIFKEMRQYAIDHLDAKVVTGVEVDDQIIIDAYGKDNHVVVGIDKDICSQPVRGFNPDKSDLGILNGASLGELELDAKRKVRGYGYKFMLAQLVLGDKADNYSPTFKSDVKFGDVKAHKLLHGISSEKEGLERVIEQYKLFYPEPVVTEDYRGNPMQINWLSVLEEMFVMVNMQRVENDTRSVFTEFSKYNVEYEYAD